MAYQPKSYRKFLATGVATALVATAVAPSAAADTSFDDVQEGQYYTDAVNDMAAAQFILGIGDGQFGVDTELRRGDAVLLFSRIFNWDLTDVEDPGFEDLDEDDYYYEAVAKAVELGFISGRSATEFDGQASLNRGEMAAILTRVLDLNTDVPESDFEDRDAFGGEYASNIDALVAAGLTEGVSETQYGTSLNVEREDFATFLYRDDNVNQIVENQIADRALTVDGINQTSTTSFEVELDGPISSNEYFEQLLEVGVELEDGTEITPEVTGISVSEDRETVTVEHENNDLDGLVGTLTVNGFTVDFNFDVVGVENVTAENNFNVTTVAADITGPVEEDTEVEFEIFAFGDTDEDAAASETVEIDEAGEVSTEFEFLPAGDHVARVTADGASEEVEFTVDFNLQVTSIDNLDRNGVTVEFNELDEAVEDATLTVVNNEGEEVEVESQDLVEGETVATFDFEERLSDDPEGTWTVNGVELDFDLQELLDDLNSAQGELNIFRALQAFEDAYGLENLNSDNSQQYAVALGELDEPLSSFQDVQDFVNDVNEDVEDGSTTEEVLEDLEEALEGSDLNLLNFLNSNFDRVNEDELDSYREDLIELLDEDNGDDDISLDDVQGVIDDINVNVAETAVREAEASFDRDDLDDAAALLEFVPADDEDDEDDTTLADLEDRVGAHDRFLRLAEANTDAQFESAYNSYVSFIDDEDIIGDAPFYSAARSNYRAEMESLVDDNDLEDADEDVLKDINAARIEAEVILEGNASAQVEAVDPLSEYVSSDDNGDVNPEDTDEILEDLENFAAVTELDASDIETDDDTLENYRDQIADNVNFEEDINDVVEDIIGQIEVVNSGLDTQAAIETINESTSASDVRTALTFIALEQEGSDVAERFINDYNSQARLEIAQIIIDDEYLGEDDEAEDFDDSDDVLAALEQAMDTHDDTLSSFNGDETDGSGLDLNNASTTEVREAIVEYGNDAFDDLSGAEQVAVAEWVLNNVTTVDGDEEDPRNFTEDQLDSFLEADELIENAIAEAL
ncbi:S-layer homology domain-containing protein [Alkalicoccus chagannorensis]|uniref:S-layer homology domain-containing protein n=1 Tax=Alkalicoccus chagannorensis TaxID=427072 RepID=UPI000411E037|nr:S-layer homology domain-containing protein [Alkalicoccus chagannorensis]